MHFIVLTWWLSMVRRLQALRMSRPRISLVRAPQSPELSLLAPRPKLLRFVRMLRSLLAPRLKLRLSSSGAATGASDVRRHRLRRTSAET